MAEENSIKSRGNKDANEAFYKLIKEMLDTQNTILDKLSSIEKKQEKILEGKGQLSARELWDRM